MNFILCVIFSFSNFFFFFLSFFVYFIFFYFCFCFFLFFIFLVVYFFFLLFSLFLLFSSFSKICFHPSFFWLGVIRKHFDSKTLGFFGASWLSGNIERLQWICLYLKHFTYHWANNFKYICIGLYIFFCFDFKGAYDEQFWGGAEFEYDF